jgi:nitroreductase
MKDPAEIFVKIPELKHEEPLRPVSAEAFDAVVQNRRSVRVYTDEPVPPEVVERALDWALLAPTSSNLQQWEFYWVRDPQKKAALVKACFSQPAARTAQELIVAVARTDTWRRTRQEMITLLKGDGRAPKSGLAYYQKLVPFMYTQGPLGVFGIVKRAIFFFRGLTSVSPREPVSHADMRVWAHKSTALACENLMLGFSAQGFDTCPMEGHDSKRVRRLLGLPSGAEVCMVISAGKRDPRGVYGPRIRMPRENFIKRV